MLGQSDRVLVALSGGADSTALVAVMAELRDAGELAQVIAVHVDHGLRPESAQEGQFCEELCGQLDIPCERTSVKLARGNIQAEARRARYGALRAIALRRQVTRIATGHTRTDQAETVLLRLLRGSGSRGLAGIPPKRGLLVRPLIDCSRAEVEAYLHEKGLSWREDPSNSSPRYLRNRVRREVVPLLTSFNPAVEQALARTADLLRADERALVRRGRRLADEDGIELSLLRGEPTAVRCRAVRALWRLASGRRQGLSARHVESILSLCKRNRPGTAALPLGLMARCRYGRLAIVPLLQLVQPHEALEEVTVPGPGVYDLPGRPFKLEIRVRPEAEEDSVRWPLTLRTRRSGDRFRPEGGRGSKTLKKWLIDRKVARENRDTLLVLADRTGEVLLLPDLGAQAVSPFLELRLLFKES